MVLQPLHHQRGVFCRHQTQPDPENSPQREQRGQGKAAKVGQKCGLEELGSFAAP